MFERRDGTQSAETGAPGEAPIGSQVDLDAALTRRRSLRARLLIVALLVAVVAAIMVPLWRALASQSQPATASAGHATALILSNVSRGTVTFNGQRMAFSDALVVHLQPGANTFRFDASPFQARSCVLTWPDGSDQDDCHGSDRRSPFYPNPPALSINGHTVRPDYIIAFPLALNDLPTPVRQQALGVVRQLLNRAVGVGQAMVRPGEHYAASMDAPGVTTAGTATTTLTATPVVALDPSGEGNVCTDAICPTTGSADDLAHPQAGGPLRWAVEVSVLLGWQFTSPLGATVARVQFPQSLDLLLTFDAPEGWRVTVSSSGPAEPPADPLSEIYYEACIPGEVMIPEVAPQFTSSEQAYVTDQGCLIAATGLPATISGPAPSGTFVWRFGVLLAADEATHQEVPQIPLATPAERVAVMG